MNNKKNNKDELSKCLAIAMLLSKEAILSTSIKIKDFNYIS